MTFLQSDVMLMSSALLSQLPAQQSENLNAEATCEVQGWADT